MTADTPHPDVQTMIAETSRRWSPEPLGHGTVREYNRFLEELPEITYLSGDLKNFQRPWVVDALLKKLPKGGRILEMGADRCELAHYLHGRGYDVWAVDAYANIGGGVGVYEDLCAKFPQLTIRKGLLHEVQDLPEASFDAVFSCSVVEHIPTNSIRPTVERIRDLLKPGGVSVHAMDLTVQGIMQNHALLGKFTAAHAAPEDLLEVGQTILADLDAFYLSPQGHHRWRKFVGKSYDDYPYRRVTSLNLVARRRETN